MKKKCALVIITIMTFIFPTTSSAQNWIDLGAKGSYGVNLLYNQNWFDSGDFNQVMGGGYSFGGKFGFNFGPSHEATFEMLSTRFTQKFKYDQAISTYGSSLEFNSLDYLLMYRKNNEGSYFEIGPQLSVVKKLEFNSDDPDIGQFTDAGSYVSKSYANLVAGFGSYFFGGDNFGVTFGFRFKYALEDFVSSEGKAADVSFPHGTAVSYDSYRATHPFTAELVCEFNWDLGYMAKANCGQRKKFLMF